jgi:hypothetical protein
LDGKLPVTELKLSWLRSSYKRQNQIQAVTDLKNPHYMKIDETTVSNWSFQQIKLEIHLTPSQLVKMFKLGAFTSSPAGVALMNKILLQMKRCRRLFRG